MCYKVVCKIVCDKVVWQKLCVTKIVCDKVVCVKVCVTKLRVKE